jgi:serine/threonine protein phosphatase 1
MIHWPRLQRSKPAVPAGRRVYAIGDVHGRLDLLDDLLMRIVGDGADRGALPTYLILLGDLIDRGPDSAGVVRRAMRLRQPFAGVGVLRGNHEQAMLDALDGDRVALGHWLEHGGDEALVSWGADRRVLEGADPEEQLAIARAVVPSVVHHWLSRRPLSGRIGDYFFTHAGVRPGVPLNEQAPEDLIAIRAPFLRSRRRHGAVVVHGHSVRETVEERGNRIGLDTGAWKTGVLTAVALEGSDRWYLSTR